MKTKILLATVGLQICLATGNAQNSIPSEGREFSELAVVARGPNQPGTRSDLREYNVNNSTEFLNFFARHPERNLQVREIMHERGWGYPPYQGNGWLKDWDAAQIAVIQQHNQEVANKTERGQYELEQSFASDAARDLEYRRAVYSDPSFDYASRPRNLTAIGFVSNYDSTGNGDNAGNEKLLRTMLGAEEELNKKNRSKPKSSLMLVEGDFKSLEMFFKYLSWHKPSETMMVTLGVGFEPNKREIETGFRAASSVAKFLYANPKLVEGLRKSGIQFMVYDATSKNSYESLAAFYNSKTWRSLKRQATLAAKELGEPEFQEKLKAIDHLKKKIAGVSEKSEKVQLKAELAAMQKDVLLTTGSAKGETVVSDVVLGFAEDLLSYPTGKLISETVNEKIAEDAGIKFTSEPLKPAAGARQAARLVRCSKAFAP